MTVEQEQLAKETVDELTYSAMCEKLKTIFGDSLVNKQSQNSQGIQKSPVLLDIKQDAYNSDQGTCDATEDAYYSQGYGQRGRRTGLMLGRGGGRRVNCGGRFSQEFQGRSQDGSVRNRL